MFSIIYFPPLKHLPNMRRYIPKKAEFALYAQPLPKYIFAAYAHIYDFGA